MLLPKFIQRSLKAKFLVLLLILLFSLAFFISLTFIQFQNLTQRKNIVAQAKAFSNLSVKPLGNAYTTYYDSGFLKFQEISESTLRLDNSISRIQIIDVNGALLYDSKPNTATANENLSSQTLDAVSSNKTVEIKDRLSNVQEIIEPYYDDFGAHPFSIRYFISYESVNKNLSQTVLLSMGVSFLVVALSAVIIIFTVNKTIISSIEKIVSGATQVSQGNLSARIEINTQDELETLAQSVNNMAASLQKNIEALKELDRLKDEFIIIASHNLRTPITILKGYVNQLITDKKLQPALQNTSKAMSVSISNLEGLVEELISIVSLETEKKIAAKTEVELGELLNQIISYNSAKALEKGVSIHFVSSQEIYKIMGDVTKLKVAFNNVLENAIKFNKNKGSVTISIRDHGKNFLVRIKDTGIGISEKEIPLVFKKFHRATEILQYNYEGLGLGLYLTRVIVEAHQGKIWFESKAGSGSVFYIELPKQFAKGGDNSAEK